MDQRDAARGRMGPAARSRTTAVREFAERASALLGLGRSSATALTIKRKTSTGDQVLVRQREMPVAALKEVAGRGVRLGALECIGFRTAADILNVPDDRLQQVRRLLAEDCIDERIREIQQGKRLLFDEFARKSEAKDALRRAVDTSDHRPEVLDDESVPVAQRVLAAEQYRLGLDRTSRQ